MTKPTIKRPAFQWYPGDWNRDIAIKTCSLSARGLWREMLDIMHDGTPYGHFAINGGAISNDQAARLVGCEVREFKRALSELEEKNVFSRTEAGIIYSRRMVRDEEKRNKSAEDGAKGAEHGVKGGSHGSKGGRPPKEKEPGKGGSKTPPTPGKETPPKPPSSVAVAVAVAVAASTALPPTAANAAADPPPAAAAADLQRPGFAERCATMRAMFVTDERHALAFDRHLRASRNPEGFLLDVEYAAKLRPSDGMPGVPWEVIGLALHEMGTKGLVASEHLIRKFAGPIMHPTSAQGGRPLDDEAAIEADVLRRIQAGEFLPPALREAPV